MRSCLAVIFSLFALCEAHDWKPCGPQKYFSTRQVDILPHPPVTGQDLTFKIWGTTDLLVKGGIINIDIGYLGMHIYSEVKNLCDKTSCPIPPNEELELTYVEKLPSFIPPGTYDVTITVTSVNEGENLQLFCMQLEVDIVSGGLSKTHRKTAIAHT
mmetsp:Transcript_41481/g.98289  ORF Transcript_41481/g.98289 Transcript_41481/m.98289 type:complete len:157 (+) Transcript_41481:314-784(+)|eukprot:CAMPEP_0177615684 /NCGR_PEP_ID=MMETSP0419_2-20121207/23620_1 /TAXON_ID=582737 /ORGANISM="Tetraselmis sp., Strain GSL018" /LENGTH=156 /DNA_ID=CAMNT_0019113425 /DNA_START=222 /DNA_END=692 /DNA_ORIENTATION=-